MNDFLNEFEALLEKYNVEIVRKSNGIIVSVNYQEILFSEDITKESVGNKWFDSL